MKEIWKDIIGCEGYYQVSNFGRVKRLKRLTLRKNGRLLPVKEKFLKETKQKSGYLTSFLCIGKQQKTKYIHRLVAQAFIPNPENKPQVNHINGIKNDNRVENLEWCTNKENHIHAVKNKLKFVSGQENYNSKLTEEEVYIIKGLFEYTSLNNNCISEIFNVTPQNINLIRKNKTWKKVN